MAEPQPYDFALGFVRRLAVVALIAALLYPSRPTLITVVLGLVMVTMGEIIRFWAAGYLLKTKELVTAGPYRYTRNPLYLGRLLIFSGMCIMVNLPYGSSWWAVMVGWLVFFGYYMRRKERVEPARLLEMHGESYQRYFDTVPALWPSWRPYVDFTPIEWSSARMRRNREYMMVIGLALVSAFLFYRALG